MKDKYYSIGKVSEICNIPIKDIFVVGFPSFIMNVLGAAMVYNTNLFLKQYLEIAIAFFGAYFKIQQMERLFDNGADLCSVQLCTI